jgi:hypothetical protein
MATQRQIEANLANSKRSCGPKTDSGKDRSKLNATRHGMAARSAEAEAGLSPEFADRRAKWSAIFEPADDHGEWALDQAVAASLRIERCGRSLEVLNVAERTRAALVWDQDRQFEAATVFVRLPKDPFLASRQLETTLAGVRMLVDAWIYLAQPLELGRDWTEAEASKALDLLGVAHDCRSGRTPISPLGGDEVVAFRLALVLEELARLEAIRDEVMRPVDEMDRQVAASAELAIHSKPAKLLMRYERDAWRRYRESIKELEKADESPAIVTPQPIEAPPATVAGPEPVARRNEPNSGGPSEAERRSFLEGAKRLLARYPDIPVPDDLEADFEWLDELERRIKAAEPRSGRPIPGNFVPIAAGVPVAAN